MAETSKTADQALAVLLHVSEHGPVTIAELTEALGLNRTVVYRLLTTLRLRGFVVQQGRQYLPGPMLVRIAEYVEPELRASASSHMAKLAEGIGETVVMHIRDGTDAVVLDEHVPTRHVVRVAHEEGSRHSLAKGASGRVLLAYLPEAVARRVARHVDDPERLARELERVRETGYAISHDELQQGVHGLGVPIRANGDRVVASLVLIVPIARAEGLEEHLPQLRSTASAISAALSGSS